MKKHLLVCLLALVLASLCMLPSQVQAAETETHDDHCLCGADHVSIDGHTTDSSRPWTPWTPVSSGQVQWPTAGNVYYYLTDDVEINETWKVVSDNATSIYICLNGHKITMTGTGPAIKLDGTSVGNRASLIITDCKGTGEITHKGTAEGPAVKVCGFGSFTMYGGTITGNHVNGNGGGVYIDGGSSKFTMYGGSITDNSATGSGGGVYVVSSRGVFVDVGGNAQIVGNKADTNENSGICIYSSSSTSSSSPYKTKLSVKKLITDARIVIDNTKPASYITSDLAGNYAIDDKGVLTAPSHKSHYLCGSSDNTGCTFDTCTTAVDFTEWTYNNSLPTSTGNYYLTTNVKLSKEQTITGNVTLCLNGYKIEAASGVEPIILNSGGTLTITDCIGSGSIVGVDKKQIGVNIQNNKGAGTLNLYGGTIKNFEKGVVNIGTFNMYGGKLAKNKQGVSNQGTFNMHGGTITENSGAGNGAGVYNKDSFTMSGGDITNNTTSQSTGTGYGGGVCNNGSFEMAGGTIKGNEAKQCGGGVYNNNRFEMTGGTITGNTAKNYGGGGVYSGSETTYIYGGRITNNNAYSLGGDVYAKEGCGVHLKGNVTIGGDRSNGLLTNTEHYIDGKLDGSAIRLFVPGGKTNDAVLLKPGEKNGEKYTITSEDVKKLSFTNAGYEAILSSDGNVILSLPHKHTLCNGTTHSGAGHSGSCGDSITFNEWTDAEAQEKYGDGATAANRLPSSGDWYLTQPVTLTATHEVDGGKLNLCLNGNSVTLNAEGAVFSVKSGGELNLTDCKGSSCGSITHTESKNGVGVSVEAGSGETTAGTFNLYNGKITGNTTSGTGGGVSVLSDGRFNMYGGSITENKAATGGGVNVADNAAFTIGGGSITNNNADTDGGGMTVGNCQVTLSGRVTITGNKSTDGTGSNLYIDKNKGGKIVVLNDSLDSNSRVVFKDCDNQYDGTYYISNANDLKDTKLACFTTDADKQFVKAANNKVYVATVLDITQKPTVQNLVYNGEEQTGVNVPNGADTYYTIDGITKATQANAACGQASYKAVVKLNPGYALYHSNTYYVAGIPLNLVWRIAPKEAAASDFVVTDSTLTTTFGNSSYKGVAVTVAKQYKQNGENWDGKLEVQYKAEDGKWTNAKPTDAGTYQLQVRIANGANFTAGDVELPKTLTIKPASQAKPDSNIFEVTAPTSINGKNGTITGVTTEMEYSTDGQNWKPCDGNTITGPSGKYQIRYAATTNYECSEAVTVNIPVHTHTLSGEVANKDHLKSEATCTSRAVYYQYCTACGAEDTDKTFEAGDMLPHEYDNSKWKSVDKTYHARPCKNCGAYDESTKEPHKFSGKEPGCTAPGCGFERKMYKVTLTTNYPVDCHVTTQNGVPVTSIIGGVEEGTAVTVSGNTLHIGNDTFTFRTNNGEQYSYTFTGWTIDGQPFPENYTINKSVTIKATFNRVVNQYTVTWEAAGGTIQDTVYTSGTQNWGTRINAPANVVKAPDSSFSYTFTGWQDAAGKDPAEKVTGNVTYTAQYTKKAHVYEAGVWKYDDSGHWHVCTVSDCGYATEKNPHTYADADATVCTVCGASRTLPELTGMVEISGELAKGERLTAVATDLPSTATQLRCQWLRDDTVITGANGMDYTLTAEDVGAKISVNVTAVGHTGSLYAIAAGQVDVIYTVSYDTNGGTIGSLRQDRVKFGADYTLPECDFITAPDKMTFDLWKIDGVSYKAGTTYRVMNDVTVVALWKDAGSDRPAPTPSRPSHKGSTIEAISTADGRSATDYSGGIYGLTFRSTASFSSFLGVQVDGGTIAPSCYSAEEGSIVVYLKAVYLRTLKAGTHTITILSSEGNASMEFTVGGVTTSPKTFDAGVAGYVSIALLGLTGSSLCLRRKEDGNA